jgi:hypothetical protein
VTFIVAKMAFGRRMELMRRIRALAKEMEFRIAGEQPGDQMEAGLLQAEIDRLYLLWGLQKVSGLQVDGVEATPELLADSGPEEIFREALEAVKAEAGLADTERKN